MANSNDYMRTYMRERYYQRKQEAISILGGKCVDCGATDSLEFDHVDPKIKSFNISKIWSYSKEHFLGELNKCVLRCKTCHKLKTGLDHGHNQHGSGLTGVRNCRCSLCKPLKQEYMKRYK